MNWIRSYYQQLVSEHNSCLYACHSWQSGCQTYILPLRFSYNQSAIILYVIFCSPPVLLACTLFFCSPPVLLACAHSCMRYSISNVRLRLPWRVLSHRVFTLAWSWSRFWIKHLECMLQSWTGWSMFNWFKNLQDWREPVEDSQLFICMKNWSHDMLLRCLWSLVIEGRW